MRYFIKHIFVIILISCINSSFAFSDIKATQTYNQLPVTIQEAMSKHAVSPQNISIIVQKIVPSGKKHVKSRAVISHLASRPRLPASTLKLFTTFSALDALGADFTWETKVFHTGEIKDNQLHGDLIIQGGADPKLVKEHIIALLEKVQAKGIQHIHGNILLDSSIFKLKPHDPSLFDNKPLRPYNAGASGLLVNFSSLILHFTPNEKNNTAELSFEPIIADTFLPKEVPLEKGACKQWRNHLQANFTNNHLQFAGSYLSKCNYGTWPIAHPDPEHFAKGVFKGNWLALDGTLTGEVLFKKTPNNAHFLTTQTSPTLASIISDINHYSNNIMTEQVFLSMPIFSKSVHNNHKQPSNYQKARNWYDQWWQSRFKKTKLKTPNLTKASGLCHDCFINPLSLHALLHYSAHHPDFEVFKNSLSIAGESGTVKNFRYRLPDSPAIGHAYLKTGTMDDVTSIAGYVDSKSGQRYSVVAIINKPNAIYSKPVLDSIIDWVAKQ